MNCTQIENLILLQDSGELTDRQRQDLDRHLAECPACRQSQADLSLLRKVLKETPTSRTSPSPAILKSIRDAAERHTLRTPRQLSIPWRGILAAAASLAICLTSLKFMGTHPAVPTLAHHSAAMEIVPLVALVMGNEDSQANYSEESNMTILADQLLILQGMKVDSRTDLMDDFTSLEDNQPTTLRWNSNFEPRPEKCG
ncbi:MAG: zf-HC2 domain-containing protein [bacterium]